MTCRPQVQHEALETMVTLAETTTLANLALATGLAKACGRLQPEDWDLTPWQSGSTMLKLFGLWPFPA